MAQSVKNNYFFNIIYQVLLILVLIITTPYISRVLGARGVGIYSYTYSVAEAFALLAVFGTTSYAIREIAYNQNNCYKRSEIFWNVVFFRCVITILIFLIYFLFVFQSKKYYYIFLIQSFQLLSVPFDISWFFQGMEKFFKVIVRNIIIKISSVFLIFTLVKEEKDVIIYAVVSAVSYFVGNLSFWLNIKKYINKPNIKNVSIKSVIIPSFVLMIPAISVYIYTSVDKIILGLFSTEAEVGYYTQAEKIVKLLATLITSLGYVLLPRIAKLISENKFDDVKRAIAKAYSFVAFLGLPMALGIIACRNIFVPLFLGSGYEKCSVLMVILAPLIVILGMSSISGATVLIPLNKQKEYNSIIIMGAVINCLLNIILVRNFQSIGVSIATIISELYITLSEMYVIRNLINWRELGKRMVKYATISAVMLGIIVVLSIKMSVRWVSLLLIVMSGVCIYFSILIIIKDDNINMFFSYFKSILIKFGFLKQRR